MRLQEVLALAKSLLKSEQLQWVASLTRLQPSDTNVFSSRCHLHLMYRFLVPDNYSNTFQQYLKY